MNTDCFPTFWTAVFLFLTVEEFLHAIILNEIQILDYTHVVFLRVTFFKFQKMYTWIVGTFKAELYLVFVNKFTMLL